MTSTNQSRHTRLAVSLMNSAKGDLLLDGHGDLCYGYDFDLDGHDLPNNQRRAGEKLATIGWSEGNDGCWTLTPAGAQFILENCSFAKRDTQFLRSIVREPVEG